jgi:NIMA (never in mitosis gene a)-related kinase
MEADAAKQGPTFRFGDFRILQEIHRSASGAVYKAQHRTSNKSFVLKEKKAPEMGPGKALDSEAVLLSNLSHPNIIRCYGTFRDSARRSLFMVLEDATSGDLQTLLRRRAQQRQPLSEDEVLALFVQVCRGVAHLHAHNIVHRDLKALNIVLDAAGVPKVCDLGVSRLRSDETVFLNSFHGTPLYLSPELVDNEPYTEKTDVWSLGVLLYQLASLRLPFEGNSLGQIIGLIKSGARARASARAPRHPSTARARGPVARAEPRGGYARRMQANTRPCRPRSRAT